MKFLFVWIRTNSSKLFISEVKQGNIQVLSHEHFFPNLHVLLYSPS